MCFQTAGELTAVLGLAEAEITKVVLRSGNTGTEVTATGETAVGEFLALMDGTLLGKADDQSLRAGYLYAAEIYREDDQKAAVILFGGEMVKVNDTYYELSGEIAPETLDRLFDSLRAGDR